MPNIAPFGNNSFGVTTRPIDYTDPHAPIAKTVHGLSIVVNGNIVGRITSWDPSGAYTREATHIYEVSHVTWGLPVDITPGRSTGFEIAIARVEVWGEEIEKALGFATRWRSLADQDRPVTIYEYWFKGSTLYEVWEYAGCWFTGRNEEAKTADGDGIIRANSTILYVTKNQIV